jgi:hypothetical protein
MALYVEQVNTPSLHDTVRIRNIVGISVSAVLTVLNTKSMFRKLELNCNPCMTMNQRSLKLMIGVMYIIHHLLLSQSPGTSFPMRILICLIVRRLVGDGC